MVARTWEKTQPWDAEVTWSWGGAQVGQWWALLSLTQAAEAAQTSDGSLAAWLAMTAFLCVPAQAKQTPWPHSVHTTFAALDMGQP